MSCARHRSVAVKLADGRVLVAEPSRRVPEQDFKNHSVGRAGYPDRDGHVSLDASIMDGDGSLLMNLGSLVTIANAAPKNFIHCLGENGTYETNGSVPIPRAGAIRFADLAKAAGYPKIYEFSNLEDWDRQLGTILKEDGPIFVDLKIEPGQTTRDGRFSLEVVACIGACGLAPVICVNGEFHAGVTTQKVGKILESYRKRLQEAS